MPPTRIIPSFLIFLSLVLAFQADAYIWSADQEIARDFSDVIAHQHPRVVTATNGDMYLVCERVRQVGRSDQIAIFKSSDGGCTWPAGVAITTTINGTGADMSHPDLALYRAGTTTYGVIVYAFQHPTEGNFIVGAKGFRDQGTFDTSIFSPSTGVNVVLQGDFVFGPAIDCRFPAVVWVGGTSFACAVGTGNWDNGSGEVRFLTTNSYAGTWSQRQIINIGTNYYPERPMMDTVVAGATTTAYTSVTCRASDANPNFNMFVYQSTNGGASWSAMGGIPGGGTVNRPQAAIAGTKSTSSIAGKVILTYSEQITGTDYDIKYLTAASTATSFGASQTLATGPSHQIQSMVEADPSFSSTGKRFRAAWYDDDQSGNRHIYYSQADANNSAIIFGLPEQVEDLNGSVWDGYDQGEWLLDVTWRQESGNPLQPYAVWLDNRPFSPNYGLPGIYGSVGGDGTDCIPPTPTPVPTNTFVKPSNTPTVSPTPAPSQTPTPNPGHTSTPTPSQTPFKTPTPSSTPITPVTGTPTPPTATPTGVFTNTPTGGPSPTPTSTPVPVPPLWLAGYWDTAMTASEGGLLRIVAVPDPVLAGFPGGGQVELFYEGQGSGVLLSDDGLSGDFGAGDGVWGRIFRINQPLAPVRVNLELAVRGSSGVSTIWPFFTVGN